jgi:TP901-1 family phage major tail protein
MAAQKGRLFLLKQGTAALGTTIAGLRATRFRVNQDTVDVTTKDATNQWRELLAGAGVRSFAVEASGVFQDSAVEETVRGYAFAGTANAFGLIFENGDKIDGSFIVTAFERSGDHDGEEQYSLTLTSAGAISFTAGP